MVSDNHFGAHRHIHDHVYLIHHYDIIYLLFLLNIITFNIHAMFGWIKSTLLTECL
jgi:hypothetical protein